MFIVFVYIYIFNFRMSEVIGSYWKLRGLRPLELTDISFFDVDVNVNVTIVR